MKISPVGAARHNKTVTFYNSFEKVPKNVNGKHKEQKEVKSAMNRRDLHTTMLEQTNWYCCSSKH
jgi:hypothetical protein